MSILEFATWLQSTPFSILVQTHSWIVPTLQSIHILGIGVVFISILMIALRVLGRMRADDPFQLVWARFAPFLWWGLGVMVITGVLLVISEPVREFMTLSFRLKMLLLAVGVASAVAFERSARRAAHAGAGRVQSLPFSARLRAAAVAIIIVWLAIIFLGRAIAYDDVVWGSWSPAVLGGADGT